jgi:hypothetical protein
VVGLDAVRRKTVLRRDETEPERARPCVGRSPAASTASWSYSARRGSACDARCCCAASTKWAWPAFDDARLLNLNKKRRKADMLRCVRRCQRGEYDFRAAAEFDEALEHAEVHLRVVGDAH